MGWEWMVRAGNPFWNRATFPHTHRIYIDCGIDMCSMCSMNVSFFDTDLFFLLIILSLFFFPKKKEQDGRAYRVDADDRLCSSYDSIL